MSTNSLYHVKQASPFPGIPMIEYAEHEQFLLHSSSQSARLFNLSTQAALEVSGRMRFLTQPPDPSLADHCSAYLGSNPGKQAHSNELGLKKNCGEPFRLILTEKSPVPGSSADLHDVRNRSIPNFRSSPSFIPESNSRRKNQITNRNHNLQRPNEVNSETKILRRSCRLVKDDSKWIYEQFLDRALLLTFFQAQTHVRPSHGRIRHLHTRQLDEPFPAVTRGHIRFPDATF
uniref:Uncharacterized protein n=1 Tax=Salix viminalis TaxID=40686 RepID=A0A6N2M663_SALVM